MHWYKLFGNTTKKKGTNHAITGSGVLLMGYKYDEGVRSKYLLSNSVPLVGYKCSQQIYICFCFFGGCTVHMIEMCSNLQQFLRGKIGWQVNSYCTVHIHNYQLNWKILMHDSLFMVNCMLGG